MIQAPPSGQIMKPSKVIKEAEQQHQFSNFKDRESRGKLVLHSCYTSKVRCVKPDEFSDISGFSDLNSFTLTFQKRNQFFTSNWMPNDINQPIQINNEYQNQLTCWNISFETTKSTLEVNKSGQKHNKKES